MYFSKAKISQLYFWIFFMSINCKISEKNLRTIQSKY